MMLHSNCTHTFIQNAWHLGIPCLNKNDMQTPKSDLEEVMGIIPKSLAHYKTVYFRLACTTSLTLLCS